MGGVAGLDEVIGLARHEEAAVRKNAQTEAIGKGCMRGTTDGCPFWSDVLSLNDALTTPARLLK